MYNVLYPCENIISLHKRCKLFSEGRIKPFFPFSSKYSSFVLFLYDFLLNCFTYTLLSCIAACIVIQLFHICLVNSKKNYATRCRGQLNALLPEAARANVHCAVFGTEGHTFDKSAKGP